VFDVQHSRDSSDGFGPRQEDGFFGTAILALALALLVSLLPPRMALAQAEAEEQETYETQRGDVSFGSKRRSPEEAWVPGAKRKLNPLRDIPSRIGLYFERRALDAVDVFSIQGAIGSGLALDVELTDFAHFGLGGSSVRLFGARGREMVHDTDHHLHFPLSNIAYAALGDDRWMLLHKRTTHPVGASNPLLEDECVWLLPAVMNGAPLRKTRPTWQKFNLEGGVTLGFLGGRVGLRPGELADFLLGFFGVDIAHDDPAEYTAPNAMPNIPKKKRLWGVKPPESKKQDGQSPAPPAAQTQDGPPRK